MESSIALRSLTPGILLVALVAVAVLSVVLVRRELRTEQVDGATGHLLIAHHLPRLPWRTIYPYLLCYAFYVVVLVLGVSAVFVWHATIVALLAAFAAKNAWRGLLYLSSLGVVAIGLFGVVIAAEAYLRSGVRRGELGRRCGRLGAGLVAILVMGWLLRRIALAVLGA